MGANAKARSTMWLWTSLIFHLSISGCVFLNGEDVIDAKLTNLGLRCRKEVEKERHLQRLMEMRQMGMKGQEKTAKLGGHKRLGAAVHLDAKKKPHAKTQNVGNICI